MTINKPEQDFKNTTGFATVFAVIFIHLIRQEKFTPEFENILFYIVPLISAACAYVCNVALSIVPTVPDAQKSINRKLYIIYLNKEIKKEIDPTNKANLINDLQEMKNIIRQEKHSKNLKPAEKTPLQEKGSIQSS